VFIVCSVNSQQHTLRVFIRSIHCASPYVLRSRIRLPTYFHVLCCLPTYLPHYPDRLALRAGVL
jgi:hypothetical protein